MTKTKTAPASVPKMPERRDDEFDKEIQDVVREAAGKKAAENATPVAVDEARVTAERFLAELPPGTVGVIITTQGAALISSKVELRDVVSLVETYKFSLLSQAERMAAMADAMAKLAAAGPVEKTA